jgi:integrase
MQSNTTPAHASGHVFTVERKTGPQWYAKWRVPTGTVGNRTTYTQRQRKLGPAWTERSAPPAGWHTRKTAKAELGRILVEAETEHGSIAVPTTYPTFELAAERWLRFVEHDRKRKRSTVLDYGSVLRTRMIPEFGELPLDAIDHRRVESWRVALVESGLSARTVNKCLVQLSGIFSWAMEEYGLPTNPVAKVRRQPEVRSGDFAVLAPAEVAALARAASSEQDAALFTVAAFTGLRLGELRGLRWRDVDFAGALVHVRRGFVAGEWTTPKGKRVRSVPLVDQAAVALDRLSRRERFTGEDDLVFPGVTGEPFDDSVLRRRFAAALRAAGLPAIRFHDLRHSFGTLAVQVFPLSDVQVFMGHADIATTMIYVHHVPKLDAAARLSALLRAESSPVAEAVAA